MSARQADLEKPVTRPARQWSRQSDEPHMDGGVSKVKQADRCTQQLCYLSRGERLIGVNRKFFRAPGKSAIEKREEKDFVCFR
jgi:hypothetical protein